MRRNNFRYTALCSAIAGVIFSQLASTSLAQSNAPMLQEILVTAQKREESLADVPISVNVISAEVLENNNINKIADITEYVPNMTMTETGVSTQMYIRGIGSGNNQGFEQSVGQYIDGIYYGRQQLIRAPFFDLERAEVLRGPQSILFGKNTIAGALNLTTARPTDETEIAISGLYEFESNQTEVNAVFSGALSDNFRARLALRTYTEDGYINNTFRNVNEADRDETSARLSLEWDATPELTISLKLETNSFDAKGRQIEIIQDSAALAGPFTGLNYAQITAGVLGQPTMESAFDYNRQANANEFSNNNLDNLTLNIEYDLNGNTLTLVSGLVQYDFTERCDCDYTPSSVFEVGLQEDYDQFSQEIRLSSPQGGVIDWVGGLYFQSSEMDSTEEIDIPTDSILGTLAVLNPALALMANLPGTQAKRLNAHESDLWAVFAQGTWNVSDSLRFTLGARFTNEDKDATRRIDILDLATSAITANPLAAIAFNEFFLLHSVQTLGYTASTGITSPGHNLVGSLSEDSFTPMINVQWDVMDNTMLYASYTEGFKAGGFDARANNPFSFEFQEEEAKSIELGSKSLLVNGRFEINAALFFTDYDDLQVSQFDGALGFNVGNANKTEVMGLELDGRYAATDNFTIGYAYSYLDFEFKDFRNGNCFNGQTPDGAIVNGIQLCDFTGKSGQYTPENNLSLFFDYSYYLNSDIELFANLNLNYTGGQNVHDNLDPQYVIDSRTNVNLRFGARNDNWRISLIGKNLSNEDVLTYAGNAPISANLFGTNTFYGFIGRPRQIALEIAYNL
ncbi:TonB-dependent receptor [Gammaproteobacteria bacterium AH-315-E17]|nr:TonB-dependent receptor [Gammaproteobacteria bacterium AH-315-E17]